MRKTIAMNSSLKDLHDQEVEALIQQAEHAVSLGEESRLIIVAEELVRRGKWHLMAAIGDLYAQGLGASNPNVVAAAKWYRRGIFESDDPRAHLGLGRLLFDGAMGEPNLSLAITHFQKARDGGEPMAAYYLGYLHHFGLGGLCRDTEFAEKEYQVAASGGVVEAFAYLARLNFSRGAVWTALQNVVAFYKASISKNGDHSKKTRG